jgi:FAD/FMN-containing dehydrogenase/Fe-S oxidoreductase
MNINDQMKSLSGSLDGDFFTDNQTRILYATDASAYREIPMAVAVPRSVSDLQKLILFASSQGLSLIPRTAGTSLAGQVVGKGIVVDVSKYFNKILELNTEERWVKVQPGVVRDELNLYLKPFGLYFGPETSTANRAMIGGMVGNNSCGSNSLIYGSTREHTLEIKALLSDGSTADFKTLGFEEFIKKCEGDALENKLYRNIRSILSNYENQLSIREQFPAKSIERRNTGYAIDILLDSAPFTADTAEFNFCKLITGSEGTLAFITEIKLNLEPVLKEETALLCIHFNSIDDALMANLIALKYAPRVSELIDHLILECTKENIEQSKNRFFVSGDPAAILVVEYSGKDKQEITEKAARVEAEMRSNGLGYHFPLVSGPDMSRIWSLRKAGLGLLSNLPGDEKAVAVIEDTAVDVKDLPAYIRDFNKILKKHGLFSVHYAHAGSGEIHLRPILNLKTVEGNRLFRVIAEEIAALVKQYNGSLSGEHGDGRLRGEFIEQMIGPRNYKMLKDIKSAWDPQNIFNPGKITDTPAMDTMLRYEPGQQTPEIKTVFRYQNQNILQHAEQCNGSGDCRKSHLAGGTMCPSFMATRNEKDTTRARANMLREMLTHSTKINRFDHQELKDVMDLCLSCKGCKSECPSNVDMAKLKAEFLQGYYDANSVPLQVRIVAGFNQINRLASLSPGLYNWSIRNKTMNALLKKGCGFAQERSLPLLYKTTLKKWFSQHKQDTASITGHSSKHITAPAVKQKTVYFFCDEFTNYSDTEIGIKAVLLLEKLGYQVIIPEHMESGRTWISKGLLRKAKKIAQHNVFQLSKIITQETPLIGVEPSAILTFRDEYIDLVDLPQLEMAQELAKISLLIDEFIAREIANGNISSASFSKESRLIKLHGHCQQKAWAAMDASKQILAFPENYKVEVIPSGCCGMAGSFGYEKKHYEISMQIGELVLFPEVRKQTENVIIAATGTSCRHQIKDGTSKKALHPIEVLYDALV